MQGWPSGLAAQPHERLTLGALAFRFTSLDKKAGDMSGRELDVYAQWDASSHVSVIPMLGWYKPKKDINQGGVQLKNNGHNLYGQLLFMTQF